MFQSACVFKFIAHSINEFNVFFSTIIALIKALPAGANGIAANMQWCVMQKSDNDIARYGFFH